MTAVDRKFYQQGLNMYVKAMQSSSDLTLGEPQTFNLGTPAASSATLFQTTIAANAVAGTDATPTSVAISDCTYGRTMILTPSGDPGNAFVVDVYFQDYLGQPCIERFTGASGSTAVLYGKKAMYRFLKSRVITPSSNAVTYSVGTGNKFGLPYKGDVGLAHENTLLVPLFKRDFMLSVPVSVADVVAGMSWFLRSPCPGFIKNVFGIANGGGSTNDAAITVKLGGVAIVGLTTTPDQNGTAGTITTGTPTTAGYNANNRLLTDTVIELVAPAAAGAKGTTEGVTITPTQFSLPDLTDPATAMTGDPRGTYEALTVPNGSINYTVDLFGDNSVNASNNGGFHGIQQFFA